MDRLNYFFRQKVTEAELDLGFTKAENADRDLMVDMSQIGVLSGGAVTQKAGGANLSVDVSACVAYDKLGQRLQFGSTQNVDVSVDESAVTTAVAGGGNSKIISVFLKFKRVLTDPRTDGNSATVYFSEAESFEFIVRQGAEAPVPTPVALDPEYILLADITRTFGDVSIVNAAIDVSATNRREDVFKITNGASHRLQRGTVKTALSDMLGWLNTEIDDRLAADTAAATALAALTGEGLVGAAAKVGATATLAAGTVASQLAALLANDDAIAASIAAGDAAAEAYADAGDAALVATYLNHLVAIPGLRLSVSATLPVIDTDITAAGTLYYQPFNSGTIDLFDGTRWVRRVSSGTSLALGGLTNGKNYDVFAHWNGAAVQLELVVWTNDTTRATALALQDGTYVQTGDATRRYIGTIRATGAATTEDSAAKRFVWNFYNRVPRHLKVTDATGTWTYTNPNSVYRRANNSAANIFEYVTGDVALLEAESRLCCVGSALMQIAAGVGIDSATVNSALYCGAEVDAAKSVESNAVYRGYPSVGYHSISWLETANTAAGSITCVGSSGLRKTGMVGRIMG